MDSITPSAINSWIGEEVRPLALEGSVETRLGEHKLTATAAVFAANDTAGTLLTFRGWALHDRRTLAFNRQPLPPFEADDEGYQAHFTHPLLDVADGFASRPGFYVKLAWKPPVPVAVELFHFDNRANPEAVNEDIEWGWHTHFTNLGIQAEAAGTVLRAQAMRTTSRPERTPPSTNTGTRPLTASAIRGSALALDKAPSSCRPPWLETTMPSAPWFIAANASSGSSTPLMTIGPSQRCRTQARSAQVIDGSKFFAIQPK